MLLLLKDQIINTDHIIRATYDSEGMSKAILVLYLSDYGENRNTVDRIPQPTSTGHILTLTGMDARLIWQRLTQLATPVIQNQPEASET